MISINIQCNQQHSSGLYAIMDQSSIGHTNYVPRELEVIARLWKTNFVNGTLEVG